MTEKRLEDCAACEMVGRCDAHITNGTWHHRNGKNPCELTIEEKEEKP
jgi:hypothetical protein